MKLLHQISFVLLVIGGVDWLLYAFNYELIRYLGGAIATVVYVLIGLAAIYEAFTHKKNCVRHSASGGA